MGFLLNVLIVGIFYSDCSVFTTGPATLRRAVDHLNWQRSVDVEINKYFKTANYK